MTTETKTGWRWRDVNGLALVLCSLVLTVATTTITEADFRQMAQYVFASETTNATYDCNET
ncbi:MAG: hypothetical protein AAGC70_12020 [Pseudomonadota bacterium]